MKFLSILSISFLSLFCFTACSDFEKSDQLAAVDKMQKSIDSLEAVLYANKIDTLAGIRNASQTLLIRFKRSYKADTMNMAIGKKMAALKKVQKAINPNFEEGEEGEEMEREHSTIGKSYAIINKSIQEEKNSLKALKQDIEKGNGKREKYNEYIAFEQDKMKKLGLYLNEYIKFKDKTLRTFYEIYEDLDLFIKALEKEHLITNYK